ncbi:hypothetical protein [Marinomonas posidonica]|uniref:hypothetical protein n=1 Tax=Marinomonas posidonica TaxID=936476 RepID=UPI003735556D
MTSKVGRLKGDQQDTRHCVARCHIYRAAKGQHSVNRFYSARSIHRLATFSQKTGLTNT